jgi:hypothetical protein
VEQPLNQTVTIRYVRDTSAFNKRPVDGVMAQSIAEAMQRGAVIPPIALVRFYKKNEKTGKDVMAFRLLYGVQRLEAARRKAEYAKDTSTPERLDIEEKLRCEDLSEDDRREYYAKLRALVTPQINALIYEELTPDKEERLVLEENLLRKELSEAERTDGLIRHKALIPDARGGDHKSKEAKGQNSKNCSFDPKGKEAFLREQVKLAGVSINTMRARIADGEAIQEAAGGDALDKLKGTALDDTKVKGQRALAEIAKHDPALAKRYVDEAPTTDLKTVVADAKRLRKEAEKAKTEKAADEGDEGDEAKTEKTKTKTDAFTHRVTNRKSVPPLPAPREEALSLADSEPSPDDVIERLRACLVPSRFTAHWISLAWDMVGLIEWCATEADEG